MAAISFLASLIFSLLKILITFFQLYFSPFKSNRKGNCLLVLFSFKMKKADENNHQLF